MEHIISNQPEAEILKEPHIKLMGGGGVASPSDPLDVSQYTVEEIAAAVEVAQNWGTYVTVHSYTAKAIQNAIRGGVRNVEHGQMIDEETAQLMKETNTSICLQPFYDDEDAIPLPAGSFQEEKYQAMISGTDTAFALAQKYDLLFGFGTDTQGMARSCERNLLCKADCGLFPDLCGVLQGSSPYRYNYCVLLQAEGSTKDEWSGFL